MLQWSTHIGFGSKVSFSSGDERGKEEKAISVYWVLSSMLVKDAWKYEGRLAPVVEFLSDLDDDAEWLFLEKNAGVQGSIAYWLIVMKTIRSIYTI